MIDDRKEIDVYLCRHRSEWPLRIFENEAHVQAFLKEAGDYGVVHRARLVIGHELKLVEPDPYFETKDP